MLLFGHSVSFLLSLVQILLEAPQWKFQQWEVSSLLCSQCSREAGPSYPVWLLQQILQRLTLPHQARLVLEILRSWLSQVQSLMLTQHLRYRREWWFLTATRWNSPRPVPEQDVR